MKRIFYSLLIVILTYANAIACGDEAAYAKAVFTNVDKNHDGFINKDEYEEYSKQVGSMHKWDEIKKENPDQLTKEEFLKQIPYPAC